MAFASVDALSVIPADAGIHCFMPTLDPGFRRDDGGVASR